jgi:hypothetical protein
MSSSSWQKMVINTFKFWEKKNLSNKAYLLCIYLKLLNVFELNNFKTIILNQHLKFKIYSNFFFSN